MILERKQRHDYIVQLSKNGGIVNEELKSPIEVLGAG